MVQLKLLFPSTERQRYKNYTNLNERNLLQTREAKLYTSRGFLSSLKYVRPFLSRSLLLLCRTAQRSDSFHLSRAWFISFAQRVVIGFDKFSFDKLTLSAKVDSILVCFFVHLIRLHCYKYAECVTEMIGVIDVGNSCENKAMWGFWSNCWLERQIKVIFFRLICTRTHRWNAPVSIALHAPGTDFLPTINSIRYLRDCTPESTLVRQFTTFHIYFSSKHIPKTVSTATTRQR